MGEIIRFQPRGQKDQLPVSEPSTPPSDENQIGGEHRGVFIPSTDALFDETRTTYHGEPVTDFRSTMAETMEGMELIDRLRVLEHDLVDARSKYILEHPPGRGERIKVDIELGKVTYAGAIHAQSDVLKGFGRDILTKHLGSQGAARVIENIHIKAQIAQRAASRGEGISGPTPIK